MYPVVAGDRGAREKEELNETSHGGMKGIPEEGPAEGQRDLTRRQPAADDAAERPAESAEAPEELEYRILDKNLMCATCRRTSSSTSFQTRFSRHAGGK